MKKAVYDRFLQIGILIRDVEKSVKFYEDVLGIGPWEMGVMANNVPPMEDLKKDGEALPENTMLLKTAMAHVYGMEIELIEPVCESQYKDWLDEHGPGIHHVCMLYNDEENYEDLLKKSKEVNGKEPWVRLEGVGGLMDVSYVDFREEAGLLLEIFKNLQPGKPKLPYDLNTKE